jgi:phage portal protein
MHHKGKAFNALCNNRGDLYIYDPERFISAQRYNFLRFWANVKEEKVGQEMLSIVQCRAKRKAIGNTPYIYRPHSAIRVTTYETKKTLTPNK